jgi:hypothetical protein
LPRRGSHVSSYEKMNGTDNGAGRQAGWLAGRQRKRQRWGWKAVGVR